MTTLEHPINYVNENIDPEIKEQEELYLFNQNTFDEEMQSVGGEGKLISLINTLEDGKIKNILLKLNNNFEKIVELSKLTGVLSIAPICLGVIVGLINSLSEGQSVNRDPVTAGFSTGALTALVEIAFISRVLYQEYNKQKNSNNRWWENGKEQNA